MCINVHVEEIVKLVHILNFAEIHIFLNEMSREIFGPKYDEAVNEDLLCWI
jgi:hypothetical protein